MTTQLGRTASCFLSSTALLLFSISALSAEPPTVPIPTTSAPAAEAINEPGGYARVRLDTLLAQVSRKSRKQFLVDTRVQPDVVAAQIEASEVTYPLLLSILRNNGLAAVTIENTVNVVPVEAVRQYPLPLLSKIDQDVPSDEWVTSIIRTSKISAAQVIPILRPLMPFAAHLAAFPDQNAVIVVDRAGNARRIIEMVRELDK